MHNPRPLYVFYGDDFTGSTDVLEQLASGGVSSVLFLSLPTPALLQIFPDVQAVGIAGDSRSRSPTWMNRNLPALFQFLRSFGAPITHYKVCSTFDSSPTHGSIGRAIELALPILHPQFVPVVVGAPHLQRFVRSGELFALGPDGLVHRIDQHPMSRHPVTPMREPNLLRHLALQTSLPLGLIDRSHLNSPASTTQAIHASIAISRHILIFDTTDTHSLHSIGHSLWHFAHRQPLFSASSSGLTSALMQAWPGELSTPGSRQSDSLSSDSPMLVISGSCSPMTATQVRWALEHGFAGIAVDIDRLIHPQSTEHYRNTLLNEVTSSIENGCDIVLYTALGKPSSATAGVALGQALGRLLQQIINKTGIRRVMLCGGDTSSHAVQQTEFIALTWISTLQPGASLCLAHSRTGRSIQLILKGGQVGTHDFFSVARHA